MRNNIVDLIVHLARRIRLGEGLNEIKPEDLKNYNKSEVSAAYSWILQKYSSNNRDFVTRPEDNHRVLHYAERMLISPEAYGYLLELVNIGIIDQEAMEGIIERVMFHSSERITVDKVKKIIASYLFEYDSSTKGQSSFLSGNESVN